MRILALSRWATRSAVAIASISTLISVRSDSEAACDGVDDHIQWFQGFNYAHYEPGFGIVGSCSSAARVDDAVVSVVDGMSIQSYRVDPDGSLEEAHSLVRPALEVIDVGEYAYVATESQIEVVHMDDQAMMTTIESLPIPEAHLAREGEFVYALNGFGLYVIDTASPDLPVIVGQTPGPNGNLAAEGSYVYIAANNGVWTVDVSDPSDPVVGSNVIPSILFEQIAAQSGYLFVTNPNVGFEVYDLQIPDEPTSVASVEIAGARTVALGPECAWVGSDAANYAIDVSDPVHPTVSGRYNGVATESAAIRNGYVYVACGLSGLQVLKENGATSPQPVASHSAFPDGADLAVFGDILAYRLRHSVEVVDMTDPEAPQLVTSFPYSFSWKMIASGSYAYVAHENVVRILDFTNPAAPFEIGSVPNVEALDLAISGDRLYGAIGSSVFTMDVSDPSQPVLLGGFSQFFAYALAANGTELYLAENFEGGGTIFRLDLSDPNSQQTLAVTTTGLVSQLFYDDGRLVVLGENGLEIFDGESLDFQSSIGEHEFASAALASLDNELLCLESDGQFHSFDLDPEPSSSFTAPLPTTLATGIAELGSHFIAMDSEGLHVFERPCAPASVEIPSPSNFAGQLEAHPNPSPGVVHFTWTRPDGESNAPYEAVQGRLQLFDVTGRLLKSMAIDFGEGNVVWDGLDDSGRPVANGVILARATTSAGSAAGTVHLIR